MIKLHAKGGATASGAHLNEAVVALAQDQARTHLVAASVAALTDNSAGTAGPTVTYVKPGTNVANSGDQLAGKIAADAQAVLVADAVTELVTTANLQLAALGLTQLTDSSGGAAANATIAAIANTVAGAATGITKAEYDAWIATVNGAFAEVTAKVNELCNAVGTTPLTTAFESGAVVGANNGTVEAVTQSLGTAADPAVTAAVFSATLVTLRNNVASLAAKLTACNTAGNPTVVAS